MTHDDLRDILTNAVPPAPGTEGWADAARKGYRRRQATTGVAAALGVIALATPVAWQLSRADSGPSIASPAPSTPQPSVSSTTTTEPSPVPSPSQSPSTSPSVETSASTEPSASGVGAALVNQMCTQYTGTVTELPNGELPDGATAIWLCNGDQEPFLYQTYGPSESLTMPEGIQSVIDAYNALPSAADVNVEECQGGDDYVASYDVVLHYGDGAPRVVHGEAHGCAQVTDGQNLRSGGAHFLDVIKTVWTGQRAQQDYAIDAQPDSLCMYGRSMITGDLTSMERGLLCGVGPDATDFSEPTAVPVPADLVQQIVAESSGMTQLPGTEGPGFVQSIVLQNAYGDPMTVLREIGGDQFTVTIGQETWAWTPSADTVARLDELATGMRTEALPEAAPESVCDEQGWAYSKLGLDEAVSTTACIADAAGILTTGGTINGDETDILTAAFLAGAKELEAEAGLNTTGSWLGLKDQDGNVFQMVTTVQGDLVWMREDLTRAIWTPNAEVTQMLADMGLAL